MSYTKQTSKRKHTTKAFLDGIVNVGTDASIEDCLNELEQTPPVAKQETNDPKTNLKKQPETTSRLIEKANESSSPGMPLGSLVGEVSEKIAQNRRHRIQTWQASFHLWQSYGRYAAGLLPSFELELARHFKVEELSKFLLDSYPELRMPSFERWLLDCKLEELEHAQKNHVVSPKKHSKKRRRVNSSSAPVTDGSDPILASRPHQLPASARLKEEIVYETADSKGFDQSMENAEKTVKELCRRASAAVQELSQKRRQAEQQAPLQKGDRIVLEDIDSNQTVSLVYHRKRWIHPFRMRLNKSHYQRLKELFLQTHGFPSLTGAESVGGRKRATIHIFHLIVMTLTVRYSSLSGGQLIKDLRGGGMQGAIHDSVFLVLQNSFPTMTILEGFASPFNNSCVNYASAFYDDLGFHFGASNNFLCLSSETLPAHYVCEVNPPFAPAVMQKMTTLIEKLLADGERDNRAVSFFVVVPTVDIKQAGPPPSLNAPPPKKFARISFERMISNPHCSSHFVLEARKHGYVEGSQHLRPTRFKESPYNTSVILLQTSSARSILRPKMETFEAHVRKAFASKHLDELESRRMTEQRRQKLLNLERPDVSSALSGED